MPAYAFINAHHRSLTTFLTNNIPDTQGYLEFLRNLRSRVSLLKPYFQPQYFTISEKERWKHTYITGSSGSGKSELLKVLIHQHLKKWRGRYGIVVLDPHGDLVHEIARHKRIAGQNSADVFFFDPRIEASATFLPRYNPLEIPDRSDGSIDVYAQHISSAFSELIGEGLTVNMHTLVKACLHVLLRLPGSTLVDLQRFFDPQRNAPLVEKGTQLPNPADREFFAFGFHQKNLDPTKSALATKIQNLLGNHLFQRIVSQKSTFNLETLVNGKGIVLFNLSKTELGRDGSSALGRFLIAHIKAIAYKRARIADHNRRPANSLFLDEFQNFIGPSIKEALTEARKFRLYLTMASQVVGQDMSQSLQKIVLANTNVKIVGRNTPSSLRTFVEEMSVPLEKLGELQLGEFFVHVMQNNTPARKIHVPKKFLGKRGCGEEKQWDTFRVAQIKRFYSRDSQAETQEYSSPQKPFNGKKNIQPKGNF